MARSHRANSKSRSGKRFRQERLRRFTASEIAFHWALVLPYLVLGASGIALLVQKNSELELLPRELLVSLHQAAGVALLVLPVFVLSVSQPGPFRDNLRECLQWRWSDIVWLHASALRVFLPRIRLPEAGRFNAGQKLNVLHVAFLVPLVAATGGALWILGSSQLVLRAVHVVAAGVSLLMASGHIYLATINPSTRRAIGGMFHGYVSAEYAAHHHPRWFALQKGRSATRAASQAVRSPRPVALTWLALSLLTVVACAGFASGDRAAKTSRLRRFIDEPGELLSAGPLHPSHAGVEELRRCASCHEPFARASSERCLQCHEEIAARIDGAVGYHGRLGTDCSACHADHRPRIVQLDDAGFQHDQATYALGGAHRRVACESCHDRDGDGKRTYLGVDHGACSDCHDDPHDPSLEPDCSHCHQEQAWEAMVETFSHRTDTSFVLEGRHRQTPCASCHRRGADDDPPILAGTPSRCRDCHEDPHGDSLATPAHPRQDDCGNCHESFTSWSATAFDHDTATRFRLDSRHRQLECASCHPANEPLHFRKLSPTLATAAPPFECSSCHVDVERALSGVLDSGTTFGVSASPHRGEVSCQECHETAPEPVTQPCSHCHPGDYDELFIEWRARVATAVLRSGELARQRFWNRSGMHNWQGTVEVLRSRSGRGERERD